MGVIESLQSKTEDMEENADESGEETGSTEEKFDAVAGDTEVCNGISEILEDANCNVISETLEDAEQGSLKPSTETTPQKTYKRKKESGDDGVPSPVGNRCRTSPEKPDDINGGIEGSPVKPVVSNNIELQATVVEGKVKRVSKRKNADDGERSLMLDVGVKTRSKKATMLE